MSPIRSAIPSASPFTSREKPFVLHKYRLHLDWPLLENLQHFGFSFIWHKLFFEYNHVNRLCPSELGHLHVALPTRVGEFRNIIHKTSVLLRYISWTKFSRGSWCIIIPGRGDKYSQYKKVSCIYCRFLICSYDAEFCCILCSCVIRRNIMEDRNANLNPSLFFFSKTQSQSIGLD